MNVFKKAFSAGLGLLLAAVVSAAVYYGYNPITGLNTFQGLTVSAGSVPVITGTCGTIPAAVGGASVFSVTTAGVTTCTLTATWPAASNNGIYCVVVDETHASSTLSQASHTATSCTTTAATITAGDTILFEVNGF